MRLIVDGTVDREGVPGLARQLGYSERQVHRTLVAEVGTGALGLARSQRAQTARTLLESTDMSVTDVAFAAGFRSVRQFNDTIQAVFAATPSALRSGHHRDGLDPATVTLRLPYRQPMDLSATLAFLGREAVPGLETHTQGEFTRLHEAPHGPASVTVSAADEAVLARVRLSDTRDLVAVVARTRRLLDLDADPTAVDVVLGADPALAQVVSARPGLRAPGCVNGFEAAVRVIASRGGSTGGGRAEVGRLLHRHGTTAWVGEPWKLFPAADVLAGADPADLPVSLGRGRSIIALAHAVTHGTIQLHPGAERVRLRAQLLNLPGIGSWTADQILMRAVGHPDVLLTSDATVCRAAADLGADLTDARHRWSPWGSYATHHLWATTTASPES